MHCSAFKCLLHSIKNGCTFATELRKKPRFHLCLTRLKKKQQLSKVGAFINGTFIVLISVWENRNSTQIDAFL